MSDAAKLALSSGGADRSGYFQRVGRWLWPDPRLMRLEASLRDIRRRLDIADQSGGSRDQPSDSTLLQRCNRLCESASSAKQERRFYVAWDCLQQIERELLATLDKEELAARWIGLL